jgi:prohibitin 1
MVNMSLRLLSKPAEDRLPTIFTGLGMDWDERVLPSIGNEVVKSVVAQYNAEQLLTHRDKVRAGARGARLAALPPARPSARPSTRCGAPLPPSRALM